MNNKYIDWLKDNKEFLSIDKIEREVGCPFTTIQQFVSGKRDIPSKWNEPIVKWVKSFININSK